MGDEIHIDPRSEAIGILKSKLREALRQVKAAEERVAAAETKAEAAQSESEKARTKFDESKLKVENDALKAQIRESRHFSKLDELARAKGVRPEALEDLRRLSEYKAEGEEPDEAKLNALIDEQKKTRPYLFGDAQPETPTPTPGPGRGQGTRETKPNGKFQVTARQLADGVWAYENSERIKAAQRDNTLEIID